MRLLLPNKCGQVNGILQARVLEVDVVAPIVHLLKLEMHI